MTYFKNENGIYSTDADEPIAGGVPATAQEVAAMFKEKVWQQIKAKRDEIQDNGGCEVGGKWYHTDTKSKQQQIALVMVGANIPNDLLWKTMDGSFVQMTQQLANQVFAAQVARETAVFTVAETHRAAVNALQTAEDVNGYDYSTGWPQTFEEAQL